MTEHFFETHEPIEVYVENGRGRVDVVAEETTESRVAITGEGADRVDVELVGRRLHVIAPQRGSVLGREHRLEMRISVPTGSTLSAKLGSSDLSSSGRLADVRVKSGSGDVDLDEVGDSGTVETGSGDVRVALASSLQVKSGSGDVVVRRAQTDVAVSTGSGDVRIDAAHGTVVVKTGSGDLALGSTDADVTLTTGSGDLVVTSATSGRVTAKGASGDVKVGVLVGTPVWTDLSTVSGRIRSGLQPTGEPEPGADHLELRARTVSGDITLVEA